MPVKALRIDGFKGGIDRRSGKNVGSPDTLWACQNMYIGSDGSLHARRGFLFYRALNSASLGLCAREDRLCVFWPASLGATPASTGIVDYFALTQNGAKVEAAIASYAETNGLPYVSVLYTDGTYAHHSINAGAGSTIVTDINCPNGASVVSLNGKLFGSGNYNVRFSVTNGAGDWTTAGNAGFLPVKRQAGSCDAAPRLGAYADRLMVFNKDNIQVWRTDPDPTKMALDRVIFTAGALFPKGIQAAAEDLFYLTGSGIRSISRLLSYQGLSDSSPGAPIDDLQSDWSTLTNVTTCWYPRLNQLWFFSGVGAYVLTFSSDRKRASWSTVLLYGISVTEAVSLGDRIYVRATDHSVYVLRPTNGYFEEGGISYQMVVEFPFIDMGDTNLKHLIDMDLTLSGTLNVKFQYDPANTGNVTSDILVSGDTRSKNKLPIEVMSNAIAPIFTASSGLSDLVIRMLEFHYVPEGRN